MLAVHAILGALPVSLIFLFTTIALRNFFVGWRLWSRLAVEPEPMLLRFVVEGANGYAAV